MKQNKSIEKNLKMSRRLKWSVTGFVTFGLLIVGVWLTQSKKDNPALGENADKRSQSVSVTVSRPVRRNFENVIVTQGNVEAKNVAMVSPRISGTLEKLFVDEGDSVIAGETKLFQTDSVKLEQNVTIRERDLAVAHCARQQAQANLEKVSADFNKADLDFKRFKRLLEKGATTQDMFEQQQSNYKQVAASKKVAQSQVELAAEQARQAEAALAIAKKDMADTTIVAPISGKVSMRMAEPGEMGEPGQPVLRIENTTLIEVSAFLPAADYPSVTVGQTPIKVRVSGIDLGIQTVSYKSPTIQPKMRTFEIKCLLESPPDGVAPGAMADIAVVLMSRQGLGVPVATIQQRGGKPVIFVVDGNVARRKEIQVGLESDGWIEILDSDVNEAASVVTMGQYMLDDGTEVSIQKEAK
jgi:multidrug efflux pump subunit AcrA (membrane-fusion protein)